MEHCKLENGMIFKILPIKKKDGSILNVYPVDKMYLQNSRKIIYDDTGNLRKIILSVKSNSLEDGTKLLKSFMRHNIICLYHDNKIKYTFIGKSLIEIIQNYDFNINSSDYLQISQKMVNVHGNMLPDYSDSRIIEKKDNVDLLTLLVNEKVYIEDIVKKNNISANVDILKQEGLYGYLSEVISDERDKKISEILAE
jgi:hypothetical protein